MGTKERYIVHVDMDAFFASVEVKDHPEFAGKPVIVGSDPKGGKGRGVVSACSYEARKYGIHSAMPISTAFKKCPGGIFVEPNMSRYAEISDQILDILETFTPDIEPISIDEAFLDITGSYHLFGTPRKTCVKIKAAIKDGTGLTASVGMAPNMMTAKIASDLKKPDGLVIVGAKDVLEFLHPLPIGKLWGVGEKTEAYLNKSGVNTIGDIARMDEAAIISIFGKHGGHIWQLANGIDPRKVEISQETGSISNENTFDEDTSDLDRIKDTLMYLSAKVSRRMRKDGLKCRTVTLKVRFGDFSTFTRAITLGQPTNFVLDLYNNSQRLLENFSLTKKSVRLVGVKASNLVNSEWSSDLFDGTSEPKKKDEKIHLAMDKIKDKFGEDAIGFRSA
ncbi:MAG: DNA polymerase IV [Candidatus Omnitrophica bacterium]|nr:DNA polymerase IV [Candidatus Omnitrophota bacterium]